MAPPAGRWAIVQRGFWLPGVDTLSAYLKSAELFTLKGWAEEIRCLMLITATENDARNRYDDGGYSGGNIERPGLQALLSDVETGLVDVIVVYKVDRLTRSLADFAKIVERLDAKDASFVSVTQAFNTTSSMGRLTLNVLLSFAQFEREVTGERIRDKIAASKKRGLWMGGPVPLGYEVIERKLVPVPEEAERVRTIMRRYIASTSANTLIVQLQTEGIVTRIQQRASGPHRGGIPFRRGSLFHLLQNPIYRGKIVHKGKVYEGEHPSIVDEDLWQQVQDRLAAKAPPRRRATNERQDALLARLLSDPEGRPMVPTYGLKGTRRYAYYETRKDLARPGDPAATRIQRGLLDQHVIRSIADLLEDEHALRRISHMKEAGDLRSLFAQARIVKARFEQLPEAGPALRALLASVQIHKDHLQATLDPSALGLTNQPTWSLRIPRPVRKPFREAKLRIDVPDLDRALDHQLITLLAEASRVQRLVIASPHLSLNQLAGREGRCRKQLAKLLRISWLSPRVVEAIGSGNQPRSLTRNLLLETDLSIDWSEQEALFGCVA